MSKRLYLALVLILLAMLSSQVLPYEGLINQFIASQGPKCTLPEHIQAANQDRAVGVCPAGDGADTIELTGDVVLTEGLPPIQSDITIIGNRHVIIGSGEHPIFVVNEGKLTLRDLRLTKGQAGAGGAIRLEPSTEATLHSVTISESQAQSGGAIYNRRGTLTINNSSLRNNRANGCGGAIYNLGQLTITESSLHENWAHSAGAIYSNGELSVSNTSIFKNFAGRFGGGIKSQNSDNASLVHVTIVENIADRGGGIYAIGESITLINSLLADNEVRRGCNPEHMPHVRNIASFIEKPCDGQWFNKAWLGRQTGDPAYLTVRRWSDAHYAAHPDHCLPTDQLGVARPQGAACDIGAIESDMDF
ncbi:MAG: hypothetical protein OXG39_07905 [Chloroflexi bacterium]|nr:hypothetical protein [Chloroflexota bacterium]